MCRLFVAVTVAACAVTTPELAPTAAGHTESASAPKEATR